MFKLIYYVPVLLSLSITSAISQEEEVLKGNVKTVREISYDEVEESDEFIGREINYESVAYYNHDGKIRERLNFYDADTAFSTYHYDEGKLVETHYLRRGRINDKTEFRYNSKGDLKAKVQTNLLKDTIDFMEIYKYDENDKLNEVGVTDAKGNLKTLYKYDDAENKVECIYPWGKVKYRYDSLGREIEETVFDDKDVLVARGFIVYEDGLVKEMYDEDPEGVVEWRVKYDYSNFDHEGNWLRKVIYKNGDVEGVVIREIEYY